MNSTGCVLLICILVVVLVGCSMSNSGKNNFTGTPPPCNEGVCPNGWCCLMEISGGEACFPVPAGKECCCNPDPGVIVPAGTCTNGTCKIDGRN